jgi:hypothetical protein
MTEQEKNLLLEEAKQRFPIGTKYKCAQAPNSTRKCIIDETFYNIIRYNYGVETSIDAVGYGFIYYDSKWAEIISKPESNELSEPKYDYEVVHCTTQEEWDFIKNKTTKVNSKEWSEAIEKYSGGVCIYSNGRGWASLGYWQNLNNTKIYSFQEWCDKFGHKPDFKPKFEVGKWYKINNCWYAKFNMIHGQNTYWQYTESITFQGVYNKLSDNIKMSSIKDGLSVVLLTDLREIQQYLPDNHPDKIKVMKEESLVDRYLKALVDRPLNIAVKTNEYVYIFKKGLVKNLIGAEFNCSNPLYEIQKGNFELMPEGFTPDNIPESTDTNWIPKVGEWVWSKPNIKNKILLGQVKEIFNFYYKIYYPEFNNILNCDKSDWSTIRKALPHEIPNNNSMVKKDSYITTLDDSYIGKYVSFYRGEAFYDKVLITKENGVIYLLNNCYSNNDGHKDKSVYKYSLLYYRWSDVVCFCQKISLLNNEVVLTPETYGYSSDRLIVGTPGNHSESFQVELKEEYFIYSEKALELYKPKDELIDTSVNNTQSVKVELYQPKKLILF